MNDENWATVIKVAAAAVAAPRWIGALLESGKYKPTIPSGPFETLSNERKAAYHDNAERNRQAKQRAQERRKVDSPA